MPVLQLLFPQALKRWSETDRDFTAQLGNWQSPRNGREGSNALPPKLHRPTVRESFRHLAQSSPTPLQQSFDRGKMETIKNLNSNNSIAINKTAQDLNESLILPRIGANRQKPNWYRMTSTT